jgi:putative phosphoesterase
MIVGVISDIHGSLDDFKNALGMMTKYNAEIILCPGDILYFGPRNPTPPSYDPKAVAELINNFPKTFIFSRGNCDSEIDQLVIKYPILQTNTFVYVEGVSILLTHGHKVENEDFDALGKKLSLNLIVSGHTHIAAVESFEWGTHLNPGSISLPKKDSKKSAAIINIKDGKYQINLKEIE